MIITITIDDIGHIRQLTHGMMTEKDCRFLLGDPDEERFHEMLLEEIEYTKDHPC